MTPLTLIVRLVAVVTLLSAITLPARAATTIFANAVFPDTAGVTDPGAATGAPNGAAAFIPNTGDLILSFASPLTGANIELSVLPFSPAGAFNILALSVGEVIGGVAVFTSEMLVADLGAGGALGQNFATQCSALSAAGCSLVRIRNIGSFAGATGSFVDAVSGVTNAPEPSIWALMLLSFGIVGWRIKKSRQAIAKRWASLDRAGLTSAAAAA